MTDTKSLDFHAKPLLIGVLLQVQNSLSITVNPYETSNQKSITVHIICRHIMAWIVFLLADGNGYEVTQCLMIAVGYRMTQTRIASAVDFSTLMAIAYTQSK